MATSLPMGAGARRVATLLLIVLCSAATLARASVASGEYHSCGQDVAGGQQLHRMPHPVHGEDEPAARAMHAQQGGTWGPIRIHFNWTYVDNPELDVRPNRVANASLACHAGIDEVWVGEIGNRVHCFNETTGVHEYTQHCLMLCNASSTVNAADRQKLRSVAGQIETKLGRALQTERLSPDTITVVSNNNFDCGLLRFGPFDASGVDIIVMVTVRPLVQTQGTIAYASSCGYHPGTGRPILAQMNVAPETIRHNENLYDVLLHELTHALGFTISAYGLFRHPEDNSKTYLEYNATRYPRGPLSGTGPWLDSAMTPPELKVDFPQLANPYGSKIYFIGPNTIAWARQHFACPTLDRVELENSGNSSSSTATHWEMRLFQGEYMVSRQSDVMKMTGLSLALFEDMGFYKANMSEAAHLEWGYEMGCAFAEQKCGPSNWPANYFCREGGNGCGYNYKFAGYCKWSNQYTVDIPAAYRYFPDVARPTRTGGTDTFADYCPYFERFSDTPDCMTRPVEPALGTNEGANSRCFRSGMRQVPLADQGLRENCFSIICNSSEAGAATVRIGNQFAPCRDGGLVNFVYPPRHTFEPNTEINPNAYNAWSVDFVGTFFCGADIAKRCAKPATYGLATTQQLNFPRLVSVDPPTGDIAGGTKINVTGTGLDVCESVRIGGIWATSVERVSSTLLVATLGERTQTWQGGDGLDGIGIVNVDLMCNISGVCPTGCFVATLQNALELERSEAAVADLASAIEEFLDTTAGKVVGALVAVVLVIVVVCVIKSCLAEGDSGSGSGAADKDPMNRDGYVEMQPHQQHHHDMNRRRTFDDDDIL